MNCWWQTQRDTAFPQAVPEPVGKTQAVPKRRRRCALPAHSMASLNF
jgi:hypothetical protein